MSYRKEEFNQSTFARNKFIEDCIKDEIRRLGEYTGNSSESEIYQRVRIRGAVEIKEALPPNGMERQTILQCKAGRIVPITEGVYSS